MAMIIAERTWFNKNAFGHPKPGTDNAYDLGTTALFWRKLYVCGAATGAIGGVDFGRWADIIRNGDDNLSVRTKGTGNSAVERLRFGSGAAQGGSDIQIWEPTKLIAQNAASGAGNVASAPVIIQRATYRDASNVLTNWDAQFLHTMDTGGSTPGSNWRFMINSADRFAITIADGVVVATLTSTSIGATITNAQGIVNYNSTAATAGAQQYSPPLRLRGYGWKTDATAASQSVDHRIYVRPIQGAAAPTSALDFQRSVADGAYLTYLYLAITTTATQIQMVGPVDGWRGLVSISASGMLLGSADALPLLFQVTGDVVGRFDTAYNLLINTATIGTNAARVLVLGNASAVMPAATANLVHLGAIDIVADRCTLAISTEEALATEGSPLTNNRSMTFIINGASVKFMCSV